MTRLTSSELAQLRRGATIALTKARSGDNLDNKVQSRMVWCCWGTEKTHTTRNVSQICDSCWRGRRKR